MISIRDGENSAIVYMRVGDDWRERALIDKEYKTVNITSTDMPFDQAQELCGMITPIIEFVESGTPLVNIRGHNVEVIA